MNDLILRQNDIDRFEAILGDLTARGRILLSVLVHKDGHLLAHVGISDSVDTTALSALISANFSSTIAIANIIGEKEFSSQFHKGETRNIYVALLDDNTFLTVIFDNHTDIETVRDAIELSRSGLVDALRMLYNDDTPPPPLNLDDVAYSLDQTIQIPRSELASQLTLAAAMEKKQASAKPRVLPHTGRKQRKDTPEIPDTIYFEPHAEDPAQAAAREAHEKLKTAENVPGRKTDSLPVHPKYFKRKAQEARSHHKKGGKTEGIMDKFFKTRKHR